MHAVHTDDTQQLALALVLPTQNKYEGSTAGFFYLFVRVCTLVLLLVHEQNMRVFTLKIVQILLISTF